jgi:hypothetical protein
LVRGLIGYTGLVGGILSGEMQFDTLYNSKNITDIQGGKFDYLICAGASGLKWKANKDTEKDLNSIKFLIANLLSI